MYPRGLLGKPSTRYYTWTCIACFVLAILFSRTIYHVIALGPAGLVYKYSTTRTQFVCADSSGGLGNILFQFAFAYSVASKSGLTMVCDDYGMKQIQKVFNVPNCPQNWFGNLICFYEKAHTNQKDCGFDRALENINVSKDTHFLGYYQSWKYWEEYEKQLKKYFTLRVDLKHGAEQGLEDAVRKLGYKSRSAVTLVAIHIRRGDMLRDSGNFGYNVVSKEYIQKAQAYIRQRVKGPIIYIVCSNDIEWTRSAIVGENSVFMSGSRELDFATLSLCDHFIMSVGTFGWWVGWQIKGIVIFYTQPFQPRSRLANVFTSDYLTTFFYRGWIGIS